MYYIQRIEGNNTKTRETVDEFTTYREAKKMIREYILSDQYANYYISTRCCKDWKD